MAPNHPSKASPRPTTSDKQLQRRSSRRQRPRHLQRRRPGHPFRRMRREQQGKELREGIGAVRGEVEEQDLGARQGFVMWSQNSFAAAYDSQRLRLSSLRLARWACSEAHHFWRFLSGS